MGAVLGLQHNRLLYCVASQFEATVATEISLWVWNLSQRVDSGFGIYPNEIYIYIYMYLCKFVCMLCAAYVYDLLISWFNQYLAQ